MDSSSIGDLLECSVCLETLGANHKVLPCQHTFCTPCLQDVVAQNGRANSNCSSPAHRAGASAPDTAKDFLCPECRTPCPTPLNKLPSNVILNRILSGMKAASKPEQPKQSPVTPIQRGHAPTPPVTTGASASATSSPNVALVAPQRARPPPELNLAPLSTTKPTPTSAAIPGNLSTNPFLDMIQASSSSSSATASVSSAIINSSTSSTITSPVQVVPQSPVPTLPPKPGTLLSTAILPSRPPLPPPPTVQAAAAASASPQAATSASASAGHQIYRALYDYAPSKTDELQLKKDELYIVIEKCQDGWFKGSSVTNLKTGVFPGNYVQHIQQQQQPTRKESQQQPQPQSQMPASKDPFGSDDLMDLSSDMMSGIFATSKNIVPPNVTLAKQQQRQQQRQRPSTSKGSAANSPRLAPPPPPAASRVPRPAPPVPPTLAPVPPTPAPVPSTTPGSAASPKKERYRCTMSYPASSEYELELKKGDVLTLLKRRDDGWCKGTLERTGQTGLFPAIFVQKL